jgi:hypothetical protein
VERAEADNFEPGVEARAIPNCERSTLVGDQQDAPSLDRIMSSGSEYSGEELESVPCFTASN